MPSTSNTSSSLTPTFLILLAISTLGPLLFGFHLAELNAPSKVLTCQDGKNLRPNHDPSSFLPPCIPTSPSQFGLITSSFTLGGLLGALSSGPVTASRGRLPTMVYASLFAIIGPICEALAPSIMLLTAGRLLSGIGAGAATVVVPIYIAEICPRGKSGLWGSATQIMTNLGILIALVLGLFWSRPGWWRWILAAGGVIAGLMMVGLLVGGVESPVWLKEKGREEEARRVERRIRGDGGPEVVVEQGEEQTTLLGDGDSSSPSPPAKSTLGPWGVLNDAESRRAVFAVCMMMLAQQFTGINSIIMYGVSLLSTILPTSSTALNIFVAALNLVVTTSCAPLSDSLGRKTCLLLSITGMGISSLLLAISIIHVIPALSIAAVIAFVASFGLGLGPIPFILASELVGSEAVGATQSWALAVSWSATFVVAQFPRFECVVGRRQGLFPLCGNGAVFCVVCAFLRSRVKGHEGCR